MSYKGLNHPNIIIIKGLYIFEELGRKGTTYNFIIVMERAECSLDDILSKKIKFTVPQMIDMIK